MKPFIFWCPWNQLPRCWEIIGKLRHFHARNERKSDTHAAIKVYCLWQQNNEVHIKFVNNYINSFSQNIMSINVWCQIGFKSTWWMLIRHILQFFCSAMGHWERSAGEDSRGKRKKEICETSRAHNLWLRHVDFSFYRMKEPFLVLPLLILPVFWNTCENNKCHLNTIHTVMTML